MKRFIAGANCPECSQSDSLYFETSEAEDRVHCSRCDYTALRATELESPEDTSPDSADQKITWH